MSKSSGESLHVEEESINEDDSINSVFESKDYISEPIITSGFPTDISFEFHHSFGYDCRRYFNLCSADDETLIFLSGNLIHMYNVSTDELEFRRSAGGGGLGHVAKNPKLPHLAVGEKGQNPLIIVYEWPSFEIISVLKDGTTQAYTHLNYSPNGDMLCSQGGEPDFLITVWNWEESKIILRCKSHGQDVWNVKFSLYVPGQLVTSGLGHIKFWKMAETFTGLKLKGELGRFGKTEICDIIGIFAMADETVLSGSEWGNILVWEAGLIKLEVRQIGNITCHEGAINHIHYESVTDEVTTIGSDGWIKMWTYSTIELADPPEEDRFIEMHPLYKLQLSDSIGTSNLLSLVKRNDNVGDYVWFAQDSKGGIFSVTLNSSDPVQKIERLLSCHPGVVVAVAASPTALDIATLGEEGCLNVYSVLNKSLIGRRQFKAGGKCLIWLPTNVEASGAVLVGGFTDGQIRVIMLKMKNLLPLKNDYIHIIQISKPHTLAVNKISLNPKGSILTTGGEDGTVFVYQIINIKHITLQPIGFIDVPGPVTYIEWKANENTEALISCYNGHIVKVNLPELKLFTSNTYKIDLQQNVIKFVSVKSKILRELLLEEIEAKRLEKLEKKKLELEKVKAENPGWEIDEELFLEEQEGEVEPLPPLFYPEKIAPILFAKYTPQKTIWVSPAGYDAGYVYEYVFGQKEPVRCTLISGAQDLEIHSFLEIFQGQYIVLGLANGKIRLVKVNKEQQGDLSEYMELSMHDNNNGIINQIVINHNNTMIYSCGSDGNIFSFYLNKQREDTYSRRTIVSNFRLDIETIPDIDGLFELSLEELKQKEVSEQDQESANREKEKVVHATKGLKQRFENILVMNEQLADYLKLSHNEFEFDTRITSCIQDKIQQENNLLQQQTAYATEKSRLKLEKIKRYILDPINTFTVAVCGISKDITVETFKLTGLSKEFVFADEEVKKLLKLDSQASDNFTGSERAESRPRSTCYKKLGHVEPIDSRFRLGLGFLARYDPKINKLDIKAQRLLERIKKAITFREDREREWQAFLSKKPNLDVKDPADLEALRIAKETIGDFKLKSSETYHVPEHLRVTPLDKYAQLLGIHKEIFQTYNNFNNKVLKLRTDKIFLEMKIQQLIHNLKVIQDKLPIEKRKEFPNINELNFTHFPENIFKLSNEDDANNIGAPFELDNQNNTVSDELTQLTKHSSLESGKLSIDSNTHTSWDIQMTSEEMIRLLYEQDTIYREIKLSIEHFDKRTDQLCTERIQVALITKYLEIFFLTSYQEFIIIKSYSSTEDDLFDKKQTSILELEAKSDELSSMQFDITSNDNEMTEHEETLAALTKEFHTLVSGNKFKAFLSSIFKKKIKIVSSTSDSDSDSSSSSDDDEDDELDLIDEDEDDQAFLALRLDKSVCPEGCDKKVYNTVQQMRESRYEIEKSIFDLKKANEQFQKEENNLIKLVSKLDNNVSRIVEELNKVQKDKQKKLNAVEGLAVLKFSQFQHFQSNYKLQILNKCLLCPNGMVVRLNRRMFELEDDIKKQKYEYKLHRMTREKLKKYLETLAESLTTLKEEVTGTRLKKLGKDVLEDPMEIIVLKTMINEMNSKFEINSIRSHMDKEVEKAETNILVQSEKLADLVEESTKKINLLTMLTEENSNLVKLLVDLNTKKEKQISQGLSDFSDEISKLESVHKNQMDERLKLFQEYKLLRLEKGACRPSSSGDGGLLPTISKYEDIDQIHDDYQELIMAAVNNQLDQIFQAATEKVDKIIEADHPSRIVEDFMVDLIDKVVSESKERMGAKSDDVDVLSSDLQFIEEPDDVEDEMLQIKTEEEIVKKSFSTVHRKSLESLAAKTVDDILLTASMILKERSKKESSEIIHEDVKLTSGEALVNELLEEIMFDINDSLNHG
uniref:Uncharacterized protein n=2 Tax=Clastoptera arizonana TaxID=38151 RepID=A0A1B6CQQ9_9HEMI